MFDNIPEQDRGRYIGAFILIALGVIFLLGQFGIGLDFNWWAIFIAIPGIAMLANVYRSYQTNNRLANNDFIQAAIGLFLLLMSASFLLDLDLDFLGNLWPVILIAIGAGMLLGYGRREDNRKNDDL